MAVLWTNITQATSGSDVYSWALEPTYWPSKRTRGLTSLLLGQWAKFGSPLHYTSPFLPLKACVPFFSGAISNLTRNAAGENTSFDKTGVIISCWEPSAKVRLVLPRENELAVASRRRRDGEGLNCGGRLLVSCAEEEGERRDGRSNGFRLGRSVQGLRWGREDGEWKKVLKRGWELEMESWMVGGRC